MNRNLDGVYFRIERNGSYENVCFSDLTEEEREKMLEGRNEKWLKSLCVVLADTIKRIGESFDIVGEDNPALVYL